MASDSLLAEGVTANQTDPGPAVEPEAVTSVDSVQGESLLPTGTTDGVQPAATKFCTQCGRGFADGSRFCTGCGARRPSDAETPALTQGRAPAESAAPAILGPDGLLDRDSQPLAKLPIGRALDTGDGHVNVGATQPFSIRRFAERRGLLGVAAAMLVAVLALVPAALAMRPNPARAGSAAPVASAQTVEPKVGEPRLGTIPLVIVGGVTDDYWKHPEKLQNVAALRGDIDSLVDAAFGSGTASAMWSLREEWVGSNPRPDSKALAAFSNFWTSRIPGQASAEWLRQVTEAASLLMQLEAGGEALQSSVQARLGSGALAYGLLDAALSKHPSCLPAVSLSQLAILTADDSEPDGVDARLAMANRAIELIKSSCGRVPFAVYTIASTQIATTPTGTRYRPLPVDSPLIWNQAIAEVEALLRQGVSTDVEVAVAGLKLAVAKLLDREGLFPFRVRGLLREAARAPDVPGVIDPYLVRGETVLMARDPDEARRVLASAPQAPNQFQMSMTSRLNRLLGDYSKAAEHAVAVLSLPPLPIWQIGREGVDLDPVSGPVHGRALWVGYMGGMGGPLVGSVSIFPRPASPWGYYLGPWRDDSLRMQAVEDSILSGRSTQAVDIVAKVVGTEAAKAKTMVAVSNGSPPADLKESAEGFAWLADLYASEGKWGEALNVIAQSLQLDSSGGRALRKKCEVLYMQSNFAEAFTACEEAKGAFLAVRTKYVYPDWYEVSIQAAYLQLNWVDPAAGATAMRGLIDTAEVAAKGGPAEQWFHPEQVRSDLHRFLGDQLLKAGQPAQAVDAYRASVEAMAGNQKYGKEPVPGCRGDGALDNNLALALVAAGRAAEAPTAAQQALACDPWSPLFTETVAFAAQSAGQPQEAVTAYKKAVELDPTMFTSWNNLGILQLDQGDTVGARKSFEGAVAAKGDFAKGWHNLGLLLTQSGSAKDFLAGHGALAKAAVLDGALRGESSFLVDEQIYDAGVDLSKPIPAKWTYGGTAKSTVAALGFVGLIVAVVRGAWALGLDSVIEEMARRRVSSRDPSRRSRWLGKRYSGWWAAMFSSLLLAMSLHEALGSGIGSWGVAIIVACSLVVAYSLAEASTAAGRLAPLQSPAPWAMFVGITSSAAGYGFLPLGGRSDSPRESVMSRFRAPLLLALVALVAFGLSTWTGVRFARGIGLGALALVASALVPVQPLAGSRVRVRWVNLALALGLAVASLSVLFSWI